MNEDDIVEYLIETYPLEKIPFDWTRNLFEYYKKGLYLLINQAFAGNNDNMYVYNFLNKIWKVKYLLKRPDGSEWFNSLDRKYKFQLIKHSDKFIFGYYEVLSPAIIIEYGDDYKRDIDNYFLSQNIFTESIKFRNRTKNIEELLK